MSSRRRWIGLLAGLLVAACAAEACIGAGLAASPEFAPRVAVLQLGEIAALRPLVARILAARGAVVAADKLCDSAVRGVGYEGSLNPTKDEARRVAAAIGCEYFVLGTSSVVERENADPEKTWDAFAGLFLVDGRSGALVSYRGAQEFAGRRDQACTRLEAAVESEVSSWMARIELAESQRLEKPAAAVRGEMLDLVGRPEGSADVIPPRFFARIAPKYTTDADRARADATVELLVEFLADGSYGRIDVVRWAGFGLTEATIDAVRATKFWPARRNGTPAPARALLRFNFRYREDAILSAYSETGDGSFRCLVNTANRRDRNFSRFVSLYLPAPRAWSTMTKVRGSFRSFHLV